MIFKCLHSQEVIKYVNFFRMIDLKHLLNQH